MSTLMDLSNGWESSGSVWSLSHFHALLQSESKRLDISIVSRPAFYDRSAWSLSPCLSGKAIAVFISTLRRRSPGTFDLVSISQPQRTLRPLNVSIMDLKETPGHGMTLLTNANTSETLGHILSLQMNAFASGGITFVRWQSDTASVVVRHCRFFQTLRLSQGMLVLTSRLQAVLASLVMPACARFVIRSLASLSSATASKAKPLCEQPLSNLLGSWAELNGDEGCNSWEPYLNSTWMGSPSFLEKNTNTKCVESFSPLVATLNKPFRFVAKFPSGPTNPQECVFSRHSFTPFVMMSHSKYKISFPKYHSDL